jgi:hypothetical protein
MYFDDYMNTCIKQNDAGIGIRSKWRIRYYNNDSDFLRLENKEKYNSFCHKRTCILTKSEYDDIVQGNPEKLFWETEKELLRVFCYKIIADGFHPAVIVNYSRKAFVEPMTNTRITFDKNVMASYDYDKFLDGEYCRIPVSDYNKEILEVKFDEVLPSYIKNIVQATQLDQQAYSKYVLSRKRMNSIFKV